MKNWFSSLVVEEVDGSLTSASSDTGTKRAPALKPHHRLLFIACAEDKRRLSLQISLPVTPFKGFF